MPRVMLSPNRKYCFTSLLMLIAFAVVYSDGAALDSLSALRHQRRRIRPTAVSPRYSDQHQQQQQQQSATTNSRTLLSSSVVQPVDVSTLERTNVCDRMEEVMSGNRPLSQGLSGMTLQVSVGANVDPFYMQLDPVTLQPIGGLMYAVHQDISALAGVRFNYTVVTVNHMLEVDQILSFRANHSDLVAERWYTDTPERRGSLTGFTQPVVDASLVLVTTFSSSGSKVNQWAFLDPFTYKLWGTAVAVIAFHALIMWSFDHYGRPKEAIDSKGNKTSTNHSLLSMFYFAWTQFTTLDAARPSSKMTALANMGFCFFCLIIANSYTANLASFLAGTSGVQLKVADMNAANAARARICVVNGSNAWEFMTTDRLYTTVRLQIEDGPNATFSTLFDRVRSGACDGALMSRIDWEVGSVQKSVNPSCNTVLAGSVVSEFGGAFAYKLDYSKYCTSFIESVLSFHIVELRATQVLDSLKNAYLAGIDSAQCGTESSLNSATTAQLDLEDMAGVIYVYLIFVVVGLIIHVLNGRQSAIDLTGTITQQLSTRNLLGLVSSDKKSKKNSNKVVDVPSVVVNGDNMGSDGNCDDHNSSELQPLVVVGEGGAADAAITDSAFGSASDFRAPSSTNSCDKSSSASSRGDASVVAAAAAASASTAPGPFLQPRIPSGVGAKREHDIEFGSNKGMYMDVDVVDIEGD